jgi:hypothetical protein
MFRVDWSRLAGTINYIAARNRVEPVGELLGDFIDFLHDNNALRFDELTLAGFSLGGLRYFKIKIINIFQ